MVALQHLHKSWFRLCHTVSVQIVYANRHVRAATTMISPLPMTDDCHVLWFESILRAPFKIGSCITFHKLLFTEVLPFTNKTFSFPSLLQSQHLPLLLLLLRRLLCKVRQRLHDATTSGAPRPKRKRWPRRCIHKWQETTSAQHFTEALGRRIRRILRDLHVPLLFLCLPDHAAHTTK